VDIFEVPADVRDHHVTYREFRGRMPGFEKPSRQKSPLSFPVILAHRGA
jgi:hypothetical protein